MLQHNVFIARRFSFEAAHKLVGYNGDCSILHGHSYKLEVKVSGFIPSEKDSIVQDNMVLDFKELDRIVKEEIIRTHDHRYLNEIYEVPTAEVMVVHMYNLLFEALPRDVDIVSVKLWETENSYAEYCGGKNRA